MNRRFALRAFVAVVLFGVLIVPAQRASASSWNWFEDVTVYEDEWYKYYNQRVVSDFPYGIAFQKYDGPGTWIEWWRCAGDGVPGGNDYSPDPDPPHDWAFPKENNTYPTYIIFCIGVAATGPNDVDTIDGWLNWDGYDI